MVEGKFGEIHNEFDLNLALNKCRHKRLIPLYEYQKYIKSLCMENECETEFVATVTTKHLASGCKSSSSENLSQVAVYRAINRHHLYSFMSWAENPSISEIFPRQVGKSFAGDADVVV